MIIRARAPLRLGLAGGGTDVSPYCDRYGGLVLNATIDKYAYTTIVPGCDGTACFFAADRQEQWEGTADRELPLDGRLGLVLHPDAELPIERVLEKFHGEIVLAIGPEGGWLDSELAAFAEAGFLSANLGSPVLCVEAAVTASLAQLALVRRLR